MKYRKKPVVVDAVQWFKDVEHNAIQRCDCHRHHSDSMFCGCSMCGKEFIETLEGRMVVSFGDWIITGVKGEFYPCKPDIFEMTYELAE